MNQPSFFFSDSSASLISSFLQHHHTPAFLPLLNKPLHRPITSLPRLSSSLLFLSLHSPYISPDMLFSSSSITIPSPPRSVLPHSLMLHPSSVSVPCLPLTHCPAGVSHLTDTPFSTCIFVCDTFFNYNFSHANAPLLSYPWLSPPNFNSCLLLLLLSHYLHLLHLRYLYPLPPPPPYSLPPPLVLICSLSFFVFLRHDFLPL